LAGTSLRIPRTRPRAGGAAGPADDGRLPALTGVRILAAVVVYLSHILPRIGPPSGTPAAVGNLMKAGYVGVTIFFVLSGFVLAVNYFDAMGRLNRAATWRYAVARFARIYPLYFVVLLYVLIDWATHSRSIGAWWEHVLMIQAWDPDLKRAFAYNGVAWSVSVEAFLYACLPLMIPLIARARRARSLLLIAIGVIAIMIGLAAWFTATGRASLSWYNPASAFRWLYRTPLTRLGDFTLGIIAARLWVLWRADPRAARVGAVLAVGGAVAIVAEMLWAGELYTAWSWDLTYAVPAAIMFLGLALAPRAPLARGLSTRVMVLLGESSYAFYLIHRQAIAHTMAYRWDGALSVHTFLREFVIFLGILAAAVIVHLIFERPARRYIRALAARRFTGGVRSGPPPGRTPEGRPVRATGAGSGVLDGLRQEPERRLSYGPRFARHFRNRRAAGHSLIHAFRSTRRRMRDPD